MCLFITLSLSHLMLGPTQLIICSEEYVRLVVKMKLQTLCACAVATIKQGFHEV